MFMKKFIIISSISLVLLVLFTFSFIAMYNYTIAEWNNPGFNSFLTFEAALTITIISGILMILSFSAIVVSAVFLIIKKKKRYK